MGRVIELELPADLIAYLDRCPSKAERAAERIDGSGMELRIVSTLLRQGLDDGEIENWFAEQRPPRYREESNSEKWLRSLIVQARSSEKDYDAGGALETYHHNPLRVDETDHKELQQYASEVLSHYVLRALREGVETGQQPPTLTEWRREIVRLSGQSIYQPVSFKTAQRRSDELVEKDYVRLEPLRGRGNPMGVYLTEKGMRSSLPVRGRWARAVHLRTPPSRLPGIEVKPVTSRQPHPRSSVPSRPRTDAQKRAAHVRRYRKDNEVNGLYRLSFRGNAIRYVQLLTPPGDWLSGKVWPRLAVAYDSDGSQRFATVADHDELRGLIREDWKPRTLVFALAAELQKRGDGFVVAEHADEQGEMNPTIGVIMQSPTNFFGPLLNAGVSDGVIRVKGTGSKLPQVGGAWRRYFFSPAGDAIALQLDADFTLEDVVETLERQQTVAADLPTGWFRMPEKRQARLQRLLREAAQVT